MGERKQGDEEIETDRGKVGKDGCVSAGAPQVIIVAAISSYIRASGAEQPDTLDLQDRRSLQHAQNTQCVSKDCQHKMPVATYAEYKLQQN